MENFWVKSNFFPMLEKIKIILAKELENWKGFWGLQWYHLEMIFKFWFGWAMALKKFITNLMYRQQGRFAGGFVHGGMGALTVLGIFLSSRVEQLLLNVNAVRREYSTTNVLAQSETTDLGAMTLISDLPKGETTTYRVKEGDNLASIAKAFGVSMDTILWENNLKKATDVKVNNLIRILPATGIKHIVKRGETIYTIAKRYDADSQAIVDYPFNTFANDETFILTPGQELFVPDGVKPNEAVLVPRVLVEVAPIPGVRGDGVFIWPTVGSITQKYGPYHTGTDIANHAGPAVNATQRGTVVRAGWNAGGYGNYVVIDHGNGYKSLYGHMLNGSVLVHEGQEVQQGQRIGTMGSTGRSTGTHLHFEVFWQGKRMDPMSVLK